MLSLLVLSPISLYEIAFSSRQLTHEHGKLRMIFSLDGGGFGAN